MKTEDLKKRVSKLFQIREGRKESEIKKDLSLLAEEYSNSSNMALPIAKLEVEKEWRLCFK